MPDSASTAVAGQPLQSSRRTASPAALPSFSATEWDALLERCTGATLFHRSTWMRVLQETYGFEPAGFVRTASDGPILVPLMEADSWLTGRRGISLPFTDECPPLAGHREEFAPLLDEILAIGRARHWRYVEFRGGPDFFESASPSLRFLSHSLTLSADTSALFARLHSSAQWAVRKSARSGVTVEFSRDLAALAAFYSLICHTRRRQGLPPQPFSFFANLQRLVLARESGWIVLARWHQMPVAGAIYLHSGSSVIYKFSASDERFQHLRPNNLVMWSAIEWYAQHGFASLDLGRTSLANEGLRRFKLAWGTAERSIDYFRYDFRRGAYVASVDRSSGWHTALFRHAPAPLARLLGELLYKHVA